MKKILFSSLFLIGLVPASLQAQDEVESTPQNQQVVEKIQNLRIAYISEKLGLTPDQAEKFWPVYREFVKERASIRAELKAAGKIDASNPDPKKDQERVELGLKVKQRELDLEKEYSGRMLKIINAQQVLNLRKAEHDFRTMLLNQMPARKLQQERKETLRDGNQRLKERKRDR